VIATGAVIVAVIGVGRVALNVHNPSDVVAGWAAGYLWFAASLLILAKGPVTAAAEKPPSLDSAP
jgi:undecaprenyl-diphosphatase